jgi:hypothetical protein
MLKNISSKNGKALLGIAFSFLLSNASLEAARVRQGWTQKQDQRLIEGVRIRGAGNWTKIAKLVPGRTATQCRKRWMILSKQNPNSGQAWTEDDDKKLVTLYQELGYQWARIAEHFPDRTDNYCKRHLASLVAIWLKTSYKQALAMIVRPTPEFIEDLRKEAEARYGDLDAVDGAADPANPFLVRLPSSRPTPPAPVVVQAGVPVDDGYGDGDGDLGLADAVGFANPPPVRPLAPSPPALPVSMVDQAGVPAGRYGYGNTPAPHRPIHTCNVAEELRSIIAATELGTDDWPEVAAGLLDMAGGQCQGCRSENLDPGNGLWTEAGENWHSGTNNGPWTEAEDRKLMGIFLRVRSQWTLIVILLSDRTPGQCRNRLVILAANWLGIPYEEAINLIADPTAEFLNNLRKAAADRHGNPDAVDDEDGFANPPPFFHLPVQGLAAYGCGYGNPVMW